MWSMTNTPNLATALPLELVGTAAVVDLEAACELFGCETLPYPLGRSRPVGSVWLLTRDVGPIEDRLDGGDLRGLRTWVEAVARAEMWVGCRVSYRDDDIPDLRLNGVRTDEVAFIAVQRNHPEVVDIVDVYAGLRRTWVQWLRIRLAWCALEFIRGSRFQDAGTGCRPRPS